MKNWKYWIEFCSSFASSLKDTSVIAASYIFVAFLFCLVNVREWILVSFLLRRWPTLCCRLMPVILFFIHISLILVANFFWYFWNSRNKTKKRISIFQNISQMKLKQFLRFLILIICSFYLSLSDESWSHTSSHKRNLCSFLRRREYHQWAILGFSRCSRELSIINFWALLLLWICTDFGILSILVT